MERITGCEAWLPVLDLDDGPADDDDGGCDEAKPRLANRVLVLVYSCIEFDRKPNAVLVGMTKAETKLLWPTVRPPRTMDSRANIFVIDKNADGANG